MHEWLFWRLSNSIRIERNVICMMVVVVVGFWRTIIDHRRGDRMLGRHRLCGLVLLCLWLSPVILFLASQNEIKQFVVVHRVGHLRARVVRREHLSKFEVVYFRRRLIYLRLLRYFARLLDNNNAPAVAGRHRAEEQMQKIEANAARKKPHALVFAGHVLVRRLTFGH